MINFTPKTLDEYTGQDKIKRKLTIHLKSAELRGEKLDHVMIYGASGLGKSTIAGVIANEMNTCLRTFLCPTIKTSAELAEIFMSINEGETIFLDEIHNLPKKAMETLYPIIESGIVNCDIDGETIYHELPKFTLIGASTDLGMLPEPLRNRFPITLELVPYNNLHIQKIVIDNCNALDLKISNEAALYLSKCCRGVPRKVSTFVRCMRDYAIVLNDGVIDNDIIDEALNEQGVDAQTGLTAQDIRYLEILVKKYSMKAVGIDLMASAMGDNKKTLEKVVEPYLLQEGYMMRTPRGRKATQKAAEFIYSYGA